MSRWTVPGVNAQTDDFNRQIELSMNEGLQHTSWIHEMSNNDDIYNIEIFQWLVSMTGKKNKSYKKQIFYSHET